MKNSIDNFGDILDILNSNNLLLFLIDMKGLNHSFNFIYFINNSYNKCVEYNCVNVYKHLLDKVYEKLYVMCDFEIIKYGNNNIYVNKKRLIGLLNKIKLNK